MTHPVFVVIEMSVEDGTDDDDAAEDVFDFLASMGEQEQIKNRVDARVFSFDGWSVQPEGRLRARVRRALES